MNFLLLAERIIKRAGDVRFSAWGDRPLTPDELSAVLQDGNVSTRYHCGYDHVALTEDAADALNMTTIFMVSDIEHLDGPSIIDGKHATFCVVTPGGRRFRVLVEDCTGEAANDPVR